MDKTRLLAELDELRKLREQVEESLQNAPSGSIRSEMAQGKYLKKSQIEIARQLVQKEYDEFAQRWKDADSDVKNTYPITNGYVTENGLVLNNKVMFPDFTILNVKKREEVYYEHFGMMDQPKSD